MPPKIKELIKKLESACFIDRGGKGSHRNFKHPKGVNITISGKPGNEAKPYQEADVIKALERIKDEKK